MTSRERISDVRRGQILQAAVEVICERGLAETRVADIAERAGTSSALILYYFATKDRLLAEALAFSEERFYAETTDELRRLDRASDQLVSLIELSCSKGSAAEENWVDEWVLWPDMWARSLRDTDVARDRETMDRRWRETIEGIVRAGQEAGEFEGAEPRAFALRLAGLIDGLAIQVIMGDPEISPRRMLDLCLEMVERELGFKASRKLKPAAASSRRRRTAMQRRQAQGAARQASHPR